MSYIYDLIAETLLPIRIGHPSTYDALHIACILARPKSYLEIGVYEGASLLSVLRSSPELNRVVLCDLRIQHACVDPLLANVTIPVRMLEGDSRNQIPTLPCSEPFDLIHVDGDHTVEMSTIDVENCYPLLRPRGIMVVDDTGRESLQPACNLLVSKYGMRKLFQLSDPLDAVSVYEKI